MYSFIFKLNSVGCHRLDDLDMYISRNNLKINGEKKN